MVEKLKNFTKQCFEGDVTMPKVVLWLVGGICLLAGIVYGLCMAPMTHGVTIGSNNGNTTDCIWDAKEDDEETEA